MVKKASVNILGRRIHLWRLALAFLTLGLIAYSPYLGSGFAADDFIFINMLEGATPYNPLYGFWAASTESFQGLALLWWAELGEGGAFLRPLASWTITLLYWLFGRNALPYHAILAIVHALGAFSAFLVLQRLSGREAPALLAALLFLICEDHAMTVSWITTITDLLCVLFLNLAFLFHIVARQERKTWLFGLSLVTFLAAMACKETAAAYPLIMAAYEFIFADPLNDEGKRISLLTSTRLFLRRWWAWATPLFTFGVYMLLYRRIIPAWGSLAYLDPFSQPGRYLAMALNNLPVMFVGLLTQLLPSLAMMLPGARLFFIGLGIVLMMLLLWALLPYRGERAVWFALLVFLLGLLPGLATEPGERLLYFPSVYGLYVVAWLILQIPQLRRRFTPDALPGVRTLGSAWGWYLLVSALILPVILLAVYPWVWVPGMQLPEKTIINSLPWIDERSHEHVVYLNTNSSFNAFYLYDIYRYHRGEYIDLRMLSSFNGRVWAKQESRRALELKTEDRGWLSNMFARVVRVTSKFAAGDAFNTELFTVTILAATEDGEDVQEARFEFELPLDDPSLALLYYDGKSYRRWEPSAEWQLLNSTIDPFGF